MADLISMEQAAEMLGISADELAELRSQKEVFGVSVGSKWKFKLAELERFAADRGIDLKGAADSPSSEELSLADSEMDFEISDDDIGLADPDAAAEQDSGKEVSSASIELEDDSVDLILEDDSEESLMLSDSTDLLSSDAQGSELRFGESDLRLAAESSNLLDQGEDSNLMDQSAPAAEAPSDTGRLNEELSLAEDELFESDDLQDSAALEDSVELDADFESSDMVLDESSGGDVVLGGNDSGVNLSPSDSGISLEEAPLELGAADIDSLELPEDDDMISLDPAAGSATQLGAEDDFNLTPLEGDDHDESSGSQVIALEDSEIYADDSGAPILTDSSSGVQPGLLPEDSYEPEFEPQFVEPAYAAEPPEHPYTIFQILSLGLVACLCFVGLMLTFDVCRSLWQPETELVSGSLMNFFSNALGMDQG